MMSHPSLLFNRSKVKQASVQKHLGLNLCCKLLFKEHINNKMNDAMKVVGVPCKCQSILPYPNLLLRLLILQSFFFLDMSFMTSIQSFLSRIKSIQYGVTHKKLLPQNFFFKELALEHLHQRGWVRRLCLLHQEHSVE